MSIQDPWIEASQRLCPDRKWACVLGDSSGDQVSYLATLFNDEELREKATEGTMYFLTELRKQDICALFLLLKRKWPSPTGGDWPCESIIADYMLEITK
ncbi:hypothetical protein [Paraburkholderia terricola]|uniref:hypothetical protein n=1 Tax=Paraburkholderia terricola TaxID=169427 RepID=UPI003ED00FD1